MDHTFRNSASSRRRLRSRTDAVGDIIVVGITGDIIAGPGMLTIKYSGADGSVIWQRSYNGYTAQAQAMAVDGSSNVVVTGSIYSWNGWNHYTAKYAAANGTLLWEKRYNGSGNGFDEARAVAVDGSGNVVVTGYSYNGSSGSSYDYYTAKYAAADGALLWEQRGPVGYAQALALDGSGNVVVSGSPSGNGSFGDYYTAKYAAANGALLWEKRYNGGIANSLALGPNGMVAIAGSSEGDYAIVVYRENLPPVAIMLVPAGVRLRFPGVPGHTYEMQRADAATGPWSTIATPDAPLDSIIEYVDINPPSGTAFYRTSTP